MIFDDPFKELYTVCPTTLTELVIRIGIFTGLYVKKSLSPSSKKKSVAASGSEI